MIVLGLRHLIAGLGALYQPDCAGCRRIAERWRLLGCRGGGAASEGLPDTFWEAGTG
jgi:hypothetical protein